MVNIELPEDAAGREIPLDTTAPYDETGTSTKLTATDTQCVKPSRSVSGRW